MKLIDPLKTFGPKLNSVQVPSRYVGGEFGITIKEHTEKDGMFNFAVAFPDMYEIAMSNLAVKIIYNGLNNLPGVRCERVFAPAPDFEDLLKNHNVRCSAQSKEIRDKMKSTCRKRYNVDNPM